jgi:hypothetical protein
MKTSSKHPLHLSAIRDIAKHKQAKNPTYRHTQHSLRIMFTRESLIREIPRAVNTRTSRAIAVNKVASLQHEIGDDAEKSRALVALRSTFLVQRLARAELTEIFGGAGDDVGV